jgi:serine protease Do
MQVSGLNRLIAAAMTVLLVMGGTAAAQDQGRPGSFAPLAKKLLPSVVNISTTREVEESAGPFSDLPEGHPLRRFFDEFTGPQQRRSRKMTSLGSGFIIDEAGYVVTNHHVVQQAAEVTVILHDDTRLEAEIVGSDPKTDLAVLKVDAERQLNAVAWGDSQAAQVGDWTLAIGNPFGLGGSVTAGIVSARGRDINAGPYSRFIQTDTAINRGNSGGPLFNMDGEVIGVNTAILSPSGGSVGVGFALPSKVAQPIVAELTETGDVVRGWLGVTVQPLTPQLADGLNLPQEEGALIGSVVDEGPAARAGLQSGDVIIGMNGEPIANSRELAWRVSQTDPGTDVELALYRDGQKRTVTVALGRLDEGQAQAKAEAAAEQTAKALGVRLAATEPQVLEEFDLPRNTQGAVIVGVQRGGPAASRGIRPGDVIARVGQQDVEGPADVHRYVARALDQGADGIVALVRRNGAAQFVSLPLANPQRGG